MLVILKKKDGAGLLARPGCPPRPHHVRSDTWLLNDRFWEVAEKYDYRVTIGRVFADVEGGDGWGYISVKHPSIDDGKRGPFRIPYLSFWGMERMVPSNV